MKQHRIIKKSVRKAINDVVIRNKHRFENSCPADVIYPHTQPSPYMVWTVEVYTFLITIPNGSQFPIEVQGERIITDLSTLPDCCYDAVLSQQEVFQAICKERDHQDNKWGPNKPQSLPGFLIVLEKELQEAKDAWVKNVTGEHATLNEVVQIAATAVACLEKYGVSGSAVSTNDIPES